MALFLKAPEPFFLELRELDRQNAAYKKRVSIRAKIQLKAREKARREVIRRRTPKTKPENWAILVFGLAFFAVIILAPIFLNS